MSESTCLLGIDAGSTLTKAALFHPDGGAIGSSSRRFGMQRPRPGWCEVSPADLWTMTTEAVREVVATSGVAPESIAAVGVTGAMVGAWLVDGDGAALRPGVNWEDSRSQAFLDARLADDPDFYKRIFRSDGCVLQQGCTLPVAAWLRANEPETFARAAHIFSAKDYLRMRMTGLAAADRTEAAVAPGDARRRDRSADMLELFGLADAASKFPAARDSESLAGRLTAGAARELGLAPGTPVAIGAGDVPATVVGAGALTPGAALVVLGTTCIVGVVSARPVFTPPDIGLLFTLPGEMWLRSMVNVAGALNLDWAIGAILGETRRDPGFFADLEKMIAATPVGSNGVVYLPYLSESGIIAPVLDQQARASFSGLAPAHGRAELMRAVYEGVVLAVRDLARLLPPMAEVTLTGGGANSPLWSQMLADALGRPVVVPQGGEFGALGAALLAGTAIGLFDDPAQASAATRRIARRHEPDASARQAWDRAFDAYVAARDRALGLRA